MLKVKREDEERLKTELEELTRHSTNLAAAEVLPQAGETSGVEAREELGSVGGIIVAPAAAPTGEHGAEGRG